VADSRQISALWLQALNAHDADRLRSLYADDAVFEAPGDVRLEGPDAIVEYAMGWLHAFPDAQFRIETEVVDGEWIAQRFTFEGTHEDTLPGPLGDIPPTHRRLVGRGSEIVRIDDGKLVEDYLYFDQMQVLTELGLVPPLR
jgi:steroid delta-isomerase-like uncharacterized protein